MEINSKKLQLSKITVSKLNKSNMKRINGGSFPCGGQRTKDENDPECDGSRVDC
ncbi:class I lanthipeptide [Aquimarina sp. MMG016]|uniref:class I lanthipeptide n=1 Tax=Aquimarina sp. MMG016 TaxID=2822690 RepID=UPI001B3A1ACB|nr:class I lanthipeptide [Aquimarina sp. MMG016]MBQ4818853.1 class I lanthipeptide [Aquimarina sp. MMG016]